jgi:RNA-binding protein
MKSLSSSQRRDLRARAHSLKPVVMIGDEGITPAVLAETERALAAHELIKIRVAGAERDDREALLAGVCEQTGAAPVQHIGKILVVYREGPEKQPARPPRKGASVGTAPDRSPKAKRARARRRKAAREKV